MSKKLLWLIPLGVAACILAAILALPSFVASSTHRAAIESLASNLTGRQVRISGKLSLGLFPAPELIATHITITGPDAETITARALTLDISLPALLHGQLSAQTLILDAPTIGFPWPLPGGPKAIAPPVWLAALHAVLTNGSIRLGAAQFTDVNADLFTGQNGAVTISGTGVLQGHGTNVSVALSGADLTGSAPITLDASSGPAALHLSGTLTNESTIAGHLGLTTPQASGTASITADATGIAATALNITDGKATLTGTADFNFPTRAVTASLTAHNLDLSALQPQAQLWPSLPLTLSLAATNTLIDGQTIPGLQTTLAYTPAELDVQALTLSLPGGSTLASSFTLSPAGAIAGQASLTSPDLASLLGAFSLSAPTSWPSAQLSAQLLGTATQLTLANLTGTLGPDHLTGNLVITGTHTAGALAFDNLDLAPLAGWLSQQGTQSLSADGELTAAHATLGPIPLKNLALDGAVDGGLNLRQASANLYGGLASGSVTLDPTGQVTAAHGFIDLPSATPLAALLPAAWQPPAALAAAHFNATIIAQGPPSALATSMVATLGDFTLTTAPVLNLPAQSATGALTLRHPNAIAAFKIFNQPGSLAFPGAGSIALRADFTASPTQYGLPDFVLSLGALTANGRLLNNNGTVSGQIDADTLALPPIPANLQIPWSSLASQGKIDLTANRVLYGGNPVFGATTANLTLAPGHAILALTHAAVGGGSVSGSLTATSSATSAPALALQVAAQAIDASTVNLPIAFPFSLPTGTINASAALTATGYSPKIWAATLGGTASLTATSGTLAGLGLPSLTSGITAQYGPKGLRVALTTGSTPFQTLSLAATLGHGNATLTQANLSGPAGTVTASGGIDIFDNNLSLLLSLRPMLSPALTIPVTILGPWAAPSFIPRFRAAFMWLPTAPPKP